MTDFRALCAELLDELSGYASANPHHNSDALVARARAALAEPAPPVAGEVGELVARLRYAKHNGGFIPSGVHWGLPDGTTHHGSIYVGDDHAADCARAADLLEQRHPAPVPVDERLPGPEDLDDQRRCWWLAPETDTKCGCWCLGPGTCLPPEGFGETHWLPANALPLPAGEVQP